MKKDIASSMDSFKTLISGNIDAIVILDSIAKQFRLLMQVKELKREKSEVELSRILGVNPYTIKKLYPYLNEYTIEDIANILYKLSNADIDIKVNGYDKNDIMERFLIEL
jgi:DNA polymerase III delta subunit